MSEVCQMPCFSWVQGLSNVGDEVSVLSLPSQPHVHPTRISHIAFVPASIASIPALQLPAFSWDRQVWSTWLMKQLKRERDPTSDSRQRWADNIHPASDIFNGYPFAASDDSCENRSHALTALTARRRFRAHWAHARAQLADASKSVSRGTKSHPARADARASPPLVLDDFTTLHKSVN